MVFLPERYTLQRDRVNTLTNKFLQDWMLAIVEYVDKNVSRIDPSLLPVSLRNIRTQYDKIFWYFFLMFSTKYQNIKTFKKTYETDRGPALMELKIVRRIQSQVLGATFPIDKKTGDLKPKVCAYVPFNLITKIAIGVKKNPTLDYNVLRDFIAGIKQTVSHEVTHFYQFARKQLDPYLGEYKSSNGMYGNSTNVLSFYQYFLQKEELDATIAEGYKLYKEKYVNKDLYDCLVYVIVERFDVNRAKEWFNDELYMYEVINYLKPWEAFMLLWTLYVYIPERFKNSSLFRFTDDHLHEIQYQFKLGTLKNNKENLDNLLKYIEENDLQRELNNFLRKEYKEKNSEEIFSKFFPLKSSNRKYLNWLIGAE